MLLTAFLFSERFVGSFARTIRFPQAVDAEKSQAKYENGLLSLTLPTKEKEKNRVITIQ
jgi:HSP20 family protein